MSAELLNFYGEKHNADFSWEVTDERVVKVGDGLEEFEHILESTVYTMVCKAKTDQEQSMLIMPYHDSQVDELKQRADLTSPFPMIAQYEGAIVVRPVRITSLGVSEDGLISLRWRAFDRWAAR